MLPVDLRYPAALPVSQRRNEVLNTLRNHQFVVVCGETGSGKTTQLPKLALEAARERFGTESDSGRPRSRARVGCTQPRRLAAASVAGRVAEELQLPLGAGIGFQVRFQKVLSRETAVKFMTDGILLGEIRQDPELRAYHTIILDEVHERSENLDFLLGYLKTLQPRRPDLKVILSSATLEVDRFSEFFGGPTQCPILQIEGRSFPVEIEYHEPPPEQDLARAIVDGVDRLSQVRPDGDILVFLPGEREIREAAEVLEPRWAGQAVVLPLYGRLGLGSQQQIFHPGPERRLILATNIAETSLTIPRIHCVLDSGLHRISRWSAASGIQRLVLEPISQANARQRAGRCGRLGPGHCLRLYAEETFQEAPPFPEPEIRRTSLAATILSMKEMGLPDPREFPLLDPPAPKLVSEGLRELQRLGALNRQRELTDIGRRLARLPIDPALGRFLLAARAPSTAGSASSWLNEAPRPDSSAARRNLTPPDEGETLVQAAETASLPAAACILAAALTIQDPRERPAEKRKEADAAQASWAHPESDFLSWLQLWRKLAKFRQQSAAKGDSRKFRLNQLRKFCGTHFLNWRRVLEWDQLARELERSLGRDGRRDDRTLPSGLADLDPSSIDSDALHLALLTGLPYHVGHWDADKKQYRCPRQPFAIFPGSVLFGSKQRPNWVLGWDLTTTTRTWARQAARIKPEWIEQAAPHLCKNHVHSPRFDPRQGAVYCLEHVNLGALRIIENRPRHYGPINPEDAHTIFVREGVLGGGLTKSARFLEVLEERRWQAETLDAKLRGGGHLFSLALVETWFLERIPADICTTRDFHRWRARAEAADPDVLHIPLAECLIEDIDLAELDATRPDQVEIDGQKYPLYYTHDPGAPDDGVSLGVHLDQLSSLPTHAVDWLVPALLPSRVEQLLRTLPKALRIPLQPYADTVRAFLDKHPPESTLRHQPLARALLEWLRQRCNLQVFADQLEPERVEPELRVKLWVCDDAGEELALGTNADKLRERLGVQIAERAREQAEASFESEADTEWSFGELPAEVRAHGNSGPKIHPCLVDLGNAVATTALADRAAAELSHRAGLARLLQLTHPRWHGQLARAASHETRQPHPSGAASAANPMAALQAWQEPPTRSTQQIRSARPAAGDSPAPPSHPETRNPERLLQLALETCFLPPLPRDAAAFASADPQVRSRAGEQLDRLRTALSSWDRAAAEARIWIKRHLESVPIDAPAQHHTASDLSEQLEWAGHECRFSAGQGLPLLEGRARHAKALALRLKRAADQPRRDLDALEQLRPAWQRWIVRWRREPDHPALLRHGHLLDDWRCALFAPELPRPRKVSAKRVETDWEGLGL